MVSVDCVEKGIASYLDTELITKLPQDGIQRVLVGTVASLMIKKSGNLVNSLKNNQLVQMLELMDENNNIDIDTLRDELKNNIQDCGVRIEVPILGVMTFHKQDVDTLYSHIMKYSTTPSIDPLTNAQPM